MHTTECNVVPCCATSNAIITLLLGDTKWSRLCFYDPIFFFCSPMQTAMRMLLLLPFKTGSVDRSQQCLLTRTVGRKLGEFLCSPPLCCSWHTFICVERIYQYVAEMSTANTERSRIIKQAKTFCCSDVHSVSEFWGTGGLVGYL
jgi:hypothetical protein